MEGELKLIARRYPQTVTESGLELLERVFLVPRAHVEHDPWEEPAFCDAEEEWDCEKPGEILGDAREGVNDTPREGESRKPKSWARESEDDVGRDL